MGHILSILNDDEMMFVSRLMGDILSILNDDEMMIFYDGLMVQCVKLGKFLPLWILLFDCFVC